MRNLILYCCDKGLEHFEIFKFERKSRVIMKEHFVSKSDVKKYNLYSYIQIDRYGRYKLPKYFLRKLSNIISNCRNGYIIYNKIYLNAKYTYDNFLPIKRRYTIHEVEYMFSNNVYGIEDEFNKIKENFEKDIIRNRINKIITIKKRIKES
jgi:hypothetical protein